METAENCSDLLDPEESLGILPSDQVWKQIYRINSVVTGDSRRISQKSDLHLVRPEQLFLVRPAYRQLYVQRFH